jgi:hypothetical protein
MIIAPNEIIEDIFTIENKATQGPFGILKKVRPAMCKKSDQKNLL